MGQRDPSHEQEGPSRLEPPRDWSRSLRKPVDQPGLGGEADYRMGPAANRTLEQPSTLDAA